MTDRVSFLRRVLERADPKTVLGFAGPVEVRRVRAELASALKNLETWEAPAAAPAGPAPTPLDEYRVGIGAFNASQSNAELLDAIRAYNHTIVNGLQQVESIEGKHLLDIGASPHGYALEHALALGCGRYMGIGLDVHENVRVQGPGGIGELRYANAEQLPFRDGEFDLVISMSTFEHVSRVDLVLNEIARVLAPSGRALVTFEPIWTCSYGHHLHHFGPVASCVPDWSHLLWTKDQMGAALADVWPRDASPTLAEALAWVYDSNAINRIGLRDMRGYFEQSPLRIEWIVPLEDQARDQERLAFVAQAVNLRPDELMTKGLTALLRRE
jgi:SAM-dependent methyltransferase